MSELEEMSYPREHFEALYDLCESNKLALLIARTGQGDSARLKIKAVIADGKAIETEPVRKNESVDKAAKRMLTRMKKDRVI